MINFKFYGTDNLARNSVASIKTGLTVFDEVTDGLVSGRLYIVSAPSGGGKTTFLTAIMSEAAKHNPDCHFLYIATEQTATEIQAKLLANRTQMSLYEIQHFDQLLPEEREVLSDANNTLSNVWFEYYDSADFDLVGCLEQANRMGIKYIFYDYLGAIADLDDSREWRTLESLTDTLKRFAARTGAFVFTATQCSNDIKTLNRVPEIFDERFIANSKGIARKADVGFIMVRQHDGRVLLDMYKNRNMESPKRLVLSIDYGRNKVRASQERLL